MTKRKYVIVSVVFHVVLILFLIFSPWAKKKPQEEIIETVEVIEPDVPTSPVEIKTPTAEPKIVEKPVIPPIPQKEEEILVPKKPDIKTRKIVEKPKILEKPPPKIVSNLKERLNKVIETDETQEPKAVENQETDLKKNPADSQMTSN
ncbi:MAG: hypothetical protein ACD_79C00256G0002 [uncultured bacterium]|nr:MAG: hypothetical protein ACD_79C00256G0002 [uncultured bacterium]